MAETTTPPTRPPRRVTFTVTGYLRSGTPAGGWYDMQSTADGGQTYSIPEFAIDEDTVRDAPPERLTPDDWATISAHVTGRYGTAVGTRLLTEWRRIATAVDIEREAAR